MSSANNNGRQLCRAVLLLMQWAREAEKNAAGSASANPLPAAPTDPSGPAAVASSIPQKAMAGIAARDV